MRRIAAVSIVLMVGAGCTLISGVGDLEALGEDGGGAEGGSNSDGNVIGATDASPGSDVTTVDALDGSSADAPADAPADVITTMDTGTDARPTANYCDGVPASVEVCLDYDSKSLGPGAEQYHVGSTLAVDGPGHDSTNALHCTGVNDVSVQCFHVVQLPKNPKKLQLKFDLQIVALGVGIEVNEIEFSYSTGKCALQPTVVSGSVQLNEFCPDQGAPDQVNHDIAALDVGSVLGAWLTYDITLDLEAHTMSGSFTKPSGTTPFGPITLDPRFVTSTMVELHPGLPFALKHTPAAHIRTDNLTLDVQ